MKEVVTLSVIVRLELDGTLSLKGKVFNTYDAFDEELQEIDENDERIDEEYELNEDESFAELLSYLWGVDILSLDVDDFRIDKRGNLVVKDVIEGEDDWKIMQNELRIKQLLEEVL